MQAARLRIGLAALWLGLGGSPESARAEAPRAPAAPLAPSAPRSPGDDAVLVLSLARDFEVVAGADGSAGLRIRAQGEVFVEGSGYRVWLARSGADEFEQLFIDLDRDGVLDPEHERVDPDGLARFGELELRVELTR